MILWLSDQAMQIVFEDGSNLITHAGKVTYINRNRLVVCFEEKDKNTQNQEIKKRLAYLHCCLENLVVKKPS